MKYTCKDLPIPKRTGGRTLGDDMIKFMSFKPGSNQCIIVNSSGDKVSFVTRVLRRGMRATTRKIQSNGKVQYGIWRRN